MEFSREEALNLITAGTGSKAITLHGLRDKRFGAETGKADAEYLKALFEHLTTPKAP